MSVRQTPVHHLLVERPPAFLPCAASLLRRPVLAATIVCAVFTGTMRAQDEPAVKPAPQTFPRALVTTGQGIFVQNCAFCHGRDAEGGETGPDLTRSKIVAADHNGDKIAAVVRSGIPDKGMPRFTFSDPDMNAIVAFIHDAKQEAETRKGGRRGVDVSDLQTGDAAEGQKFFNGSGGCSGCHSPTGDLKGLASRIEGLHLEERMLYPGRGKPRVTITLPSETISGDLAYRDEFTVALRDSTGKYRSFRADQVHYAVEQPTEAHVRLLPLYTDADIHNLMAYLQTLR